MPTRYSHETDLEEITPKIKRHHVTNFLKVLTFVRDAAPFNARGRHLHYALSFGTARGCLPKRGPHSGTNAGMLEAADNHPRDYKRGEDYWDCFWRS